MIGLCPDWDDWDPKDALQNATEALSLADDWLRIPQVKIHYHYLQFAYIFSYPCTSYYHHFASCLKKFNSSYSPYSYLIILLCCYAYP